ncbi:probable cysteine--tRNA ligase, mitochondrial isoform X2 [Carcharodon carcharias]|uniref:probable cysteine--tRNA ligase, mitochondrial isoform X2 n=1 Tax=Carcharodon carcharias TaxID=13397 RepID=UPI001B7F25C5|nr:probable cysteine--tRNA ligase, mitochondrial isoform X2 [Carcharodon carcharias]XP_041055969.1 probable cysteine--tRNA ligase, mitochondrial isoform X2 [Carcharodon carcharias]XP_041055970.1 probable cysteine--tRNA ligase, mitochondrial isoform X2 [Carcharodon carcharias]
MMRGIGHSTQNVVPTQECVKFFSKGLSYVRFDILRRILTKVFDIDVIMLMVITDIDDKIIQRANELNISPTVLARMYEEDFKQDMACLKVLPPTVYMRVTDNIPQIVKFIERIIHNGHAYSTSTGNVYFNIQSIGGQYGKFVGMCADTAGETSGGDKRHVRDFALWKASKPHEPSWVSPWGKGRPGWHIECSTVASSVFGNKLDIHSGGIDLAFPHHENEIAQCEAYHKCEQWGNYFLHSGHLRLKGSEAKMSKSLKNYITIKSFLEKFSANHFRMFCLLSKYRSAVEYSDTSMTEAGNLLHSISAFINDASAYMKGQLICPSVDETLLWERLNAAKVNVQAAFADDFDTPGATDSIMNLIHHGNRQLQAVTKEGDYPRSPAVFGAIISYIERFLDVVGISLGESQVRAVDQSSATLRSVAEQLVGFRQEVRKFALAVDDQELAMSEGRELSKEEKQQVKERHRQLLSERQPLLQTCDSLRQNLSAIGINIKDRGATSSWELTEHLTKENKSEA